MKLSIRPIIITIAISATILSCAKQVTEDDDTIEQRALDAWIAKYVPGAVQLGDYGIYYEVLTPAEPGAQSIELGNWLFSDYVLRDLDGNVIYNRNADIARQQGQFSNYTRYVDDYFGIPEDISAVSYMQGMYYGYIDMKVGEMRRFYMPSKYGYGEGSLQNSYGYGGQYALGAYSPLILDNMVVNEVVPDPEIREQEMVEELAAKWENENGELIKIKDYFYMQILAREQNAKQIEIDKDVEFHFIGRYAEDGIVFDTNIDTVWSNTFGELRKYDPITPVSITYKEEMSLESMPDVTFSFLLPELCYGDSVRVVTISDYAYQTLGKPGYRTTTLSTDGDDFAAVLLLSYLMGGSQESLYYNSEDYWSMMYFMAMTAQNEEVTEVVPEVKLYTPVTFTFVVLDDPDIEEEES